MGGRKKKSLSMYLSIGRSPPRLKGGSGKGEEGEDGEKN